MIKLFSSIEEAKQVVADNQIKLMLIDGRKYALARIGNKFYAFDNACPHQRESLHKGKITRYGEVVCPLHFYRFNLVNGTETSNRCQPLFTYAILLRKNGIFLNLV